MIKKFKQPLSQKEKSLKLLYTLINDLGPISKSDLIAETGLTQTTCSRLIEDLSEQQLILESGVGESSGGRKPLLYKINPTLYYLIGIDISRTFTKVLLMDLHLTVITESRLKMDVTSTPDLTIDFITNEINQMLSKQNLKKEQLLGIGVGTIGPIYREEGLILNPINFPSPGWVDVPIKDLLRKKLALDVVVDYGVNTALLAEYKHEFFRKYKNIVYVLKGTGNRSSLIIDGRLTHGPEKLGIYGQGHMVVDINGRKCICGGYGCVHAYSSIQAIKTDVIHHLKLGKTSILTERVDNIENVQFEDICEAVNDHDPLCCEIIQNAAYYTGIGLSNLINVLQPELIILNGPTYSNMDLFYEVVSKTASERSRVIFPNHEIVFSRGNLGENASAIGAGQLLLDSFLT